MDLARGALSWNVLFSNVIGGLACAPCYLVSYSCGLVAVALREQVARALSRAVHLRRMLPGRAPMY